MYLIAFIAALVLVILSEGIGQWLCKKLSIDTAGFAAPYGTAAIFTVLEILYLPVLLNNGHFLWIKISTMIVIVVCVVLFCFTLKNCFHSIFRGRIIYVLLSASLLLVLFWLGQQNINITADSELSLMAANADSITISLGNMRLQGYELFGSFLIWCFSQNASAACLMLGLYANMITVMAILNMVDSFDIKNPWFRFTLILCSVFYCQFYAWKITGSFHGANWRLLFTALMLYTIYRWLKVRNEHIKYLLLFVTGAGLMTHNGFFMISFEIIYCMTIWLLRSKKIRSLFDLITFMIPFVIYFSCWLGQYNAWIGWLVFIAYMFLCLHRERKKGYHHIIQVEDYLIDHSRVIFYIAIPSIFLIGTFILRFFISDYGVQYSRYIEFFQETPIRSYIFLSGNWIDYILDAIRWIGLFFFMINAFHHEDTCIRTIFLAMVIFFVNPLCMGMLSWIVGINGYAYAFEIIFNPFTDVMLFWWIYRQFEWTVVGQWILEITLVAALLFGHVTSFTNSPTGLYTDLLTHDPQTGRVIIP